MDITIIETGEQVALSLIDPASGVNWINDLMGNHCALPEHDHETGRYRMTQADYDWWLDVVTAYQAADNRYYALLESLDYDERMALMMAVNERCAVDLEDYPAYLQKVCDDYHATA